MTHSIKPFTHSESYTLDKLSLYNWGGFANFRHANFDSRGSGVIGISGSGKTTLIDALMTLITKNPQYNLASTGGEKSDRSLVSYIRGYVGSGNSTSNQHILRPKATITGLCARLISSTHIVQLGAIFSFEKASTSPKDQKTTWLFSVHPKENLDQVDTLNLEQWVDLYHQNNMKYFRRVIKEAPNFHYFDTKKAYLAKVNHHFKVNKNVFSLLNRAAGLKRLKDLNEIFRDYVLDESNIFSSVEKAIVSFDDLKSSYAELQRAREQRDSLLPIKNNYEIYDKNQAKLNELQLVKSSLSVFFAEHAYRLWASEIKRLDSEIVDITQSLNDKVLERNKHVNLRNALQDKYGNSGGNSINNLERLIAEKLKTLQQKEKKALFYQTVMRALRLNIDISLSAFEHNKKQLASIEETLNEKIEIEKKVLHKIGAQRFSLDETLKKLHDEHQQAKASPNTNIDTPFLTFRQQLADLLNLEPNDLPFVAELIDVKEEQKAWQGAIERAIGGHRLRILISKEYIEEALEWVNHKHHGVHIRLLKVSKNQKPVDFLHDGFTRKLEYKKHPLREALKSFLSEIDLHCVDSAKELKDKSYSLTKEGLISGKEGYYNKQDHKLLSSGWKIGTNNALRLQQLETNINDNKNKLNSIHAEYSQQSHKVDAAQKEMSRFDDVKELSFESIDAETAKHEIQNYQEELGVLLSKNSDTQKIKQELEQQERIVQKIDDELNETKSVKMAKEKEHAQCIKNRAEALRDVGDGLIDEQRVMVNSYLPKDIIESLTTENINRQEKIQLREIDQKIRELDEKNSNIKMKLGSYMRKALDLNAGELTDVGADLQDIPDYFKRLEQLEKEGLPKKEKRFKEYLTDSSTQTLVSLDTQIDGELRNIKMRIDNLNQTLRNVDFLPQQYLQLVPKEISSEVVRSFRKTIQEIRLYALQDGQEELHYKTTEKAINQLKSALDKKRTIASKQLLDPRYRLDFSVNIIDSQTNSILETRTNSDGDSGGEKEIITSYILIASLRYALCSNNEAYPLFSTIILDEAFSRSSQAFASRIVNTLHEFGLHPIFVTPNKELQLLRKYTHSATIIHKNQNQVANLITISWEEAEKYLKGIDKP